MKKIFIFILFVLFVFVFYINAKEVYKVYYIKGKIIAKTGTHKIVLKKGMIIDSSYFLKTKSNSNIVLKTTNRRIISIEENKLIFLKNLSKNKKSISSKILRLKNKFLKHKQNNSYSPTAVAGVLGDNIQKHNKKELKQTLFWEK